MCTVCVSASVGWTSVCVFVCVWWGQNSEPPFSPQFAFLETIVTAVTDEFPYYLRPKKAVFSGLICVAMYLLGLVLTTDVSGAVGWADSWWARLGQTPAALSVARPNMPQATCFFLCGRKLVDPRASFSRGSLAYDPEF